MGTIRYIDLFCGLGAFHTAFSESTEFKCVFACDINSDVQDIYEKNHGIRPHGDIRELNPDTLPNFEILCAGFPCQPFSIAGNGEGFADIEKGNLFFDILRIIDAKSPKMCILENVKNLKTHDHGKTYESIKGHLESRGYIVTSKVLNGVDFGSPQARQRIFIVASRASFEIPDGVPSRKCVKDILDSTETGTCNFNNYDLISKTSKAYPDKPHILFDVVSKTTGKGGRQGERVYDISHPGITVCASSGGIGSKTGLYWINGVARRLNVLETLRMFGFPDSYKFEKTGKEDSLFFLGNSIVVDIVRAFVPAVSEHFKEHA